MRSHVGILARAKAQLFWIELCPLILSGSCKQALTLILASLQFTDLEIWICHRCMCHSHCICKEHQCYIQEHPPCGLSPSNKVCKWTGFHYGGWWGGWGGFKSISAMPSQVLIPHEFTACLLRNTCVIRVSCVEEYMSLNHGLYSYHSSLNFSHLLVCSNLMSWC